MGCIQSAAYKTKSGSIRQHWHHTYQLFFVTKGKARMRIADRTYDVGACSLVFISNLEAHEILRCEGVFERFVVEIIPAAAHQYLKDPMLLSIFTNRPSGFCHVIDGARLKNRLQILFEMLVDARAQEERFPDASDMILTLALVELYRVLPDSFPSDNRTTPGIVYEVKRRLEQNVKELVSLESLAREYHTSLFNLAHSFKRITGYSIKQYHILCRLAAARALLAQTDLRITEIAERTGFGDSSNFSRSFRAVMHCTPSAYRKQQKTQGMR